MDMLLNVLIALAVLALVLYRQLSARRVDDTRTSYRMPLLLGVVGIAQGGIVDMGHPALSVVLLAAEAVAAVAFGALRAATMRVWRDETNALWRKGTGWTLAAWLLSIASRVGLIALAHVLGVRQGTGGLLLFFGLTLLAQNAIVAWRAVSQGGRPPYDPPRSRPATSQNSVSGRADPPATAPTG
jgi:FtsH-binding integral membrane protein